MWEKPLEPPGLPCVAVDFHLAGELAARHLIELGHRRIGAIVGSKAYGIHAARYDGFVSAMEAAGLDAQAAPVVHAIDTSQGGYAAARELLTRHPDLTALFTTNDLPALGAMQAAADLGFDVPNRLSVVGITDIQLASESRPALTTVAVPTVEAAELGVALLRELIASEARTAQHGAREAKVCVASEPYLVVRASTARVQS
jgi:DNA-binding LacI/PurR family transcriptional regulator